MTLDHLCENKRCVNPAHLEVVTRGDNVRRYYAKVTHCPQGHEYTPDNLVRHNRWGRGMCKTCMRERSRQRRAAA